jgi:hypothetical protein
MAIKKGKCMRYRITGIIVLLLLIITAIGVFIWQSQKKIDQNTEFLSEHTQKHDDYWFLLHRKSKKEYLYKGIPGDASQSALVKEFKVNVGIINERPTPLPGLAGREYWNIIAEFEMKDDPETAPYFLTLDIPWSDEYPYGPQPYEECDGKQCDWVKPGSFGLHGIAGNPEKLIDAGSSGCIRHTDEEITYLYNLLTPSEQYPIRYYIEDMKISKNVSP